MPAREHILHKVRTALGRSAGQPPEAAPEARLRVHDVDREERVRRMLDKLLDDGFIRKPQHGYYTRLRMS